MNGRGEKITGISDRLRGHLHSSRWEAVWLGQGAGAKVRQVRPQGYKIPGHAHSQGCASAGSDSPSLHCWRRQKDVGSWKIYFGGNGQDRKKKLFWEYKVQKWVIILERSLCNSPWRVLNNGERNSDFLQELRKAHGIKEMKLLEKKWNSLSWQKTVELHSHSGPWNNFDDANHVLRNKREIQ